VKASVWGERKAERIGDNKRSNQMEKKMAPYSEWKDVTTKPVSKALVSLLGKAFAGEETHQSEKVAAFAEKLAADAHNASKNFTALHDAVMNFIRNLDGCSDYQPCVGVLGDSEFAILILESLERRGKTPTEKWAPMILRGAQVQMTDLFKKWAASVTGTLGL
jgi:hypothetical protein